MTERQDARLRPPGWTLEQKVQLAAQVMGLGEATSQLQGTALERLIDTAVQQLFRLMMPMDLRAPVDEQWSQLRQGFRRFGRVSEHLGRLPVVGDWLIGLTSRLIGQVAYRNGFWQISVDRASDMEGLANEYLKFAEGIDLEIDYERSTIGPDEATLYVTRCSAGVTRGYPKATCMAMNEMDRELIGLLGGRLQTTRTLADDGQHCCFRVTFS